MMADGCSWPWWPLCHIVLMDLAGLSFLPCEQAPKTNPSALRGQQLRLRGPQGSWAQPSDHECAMLPICRRRGSTYRNRHPKPKSKAPGKGGFVGVVGQLGLLWGASVPTGTRERRLVTGIKISLSALRKSSAARLLQRYRNRPPRAQIEGTWQRGVRGCCGAAGVALGCFSSDPNARAAFGYWNQNFRYLPYENCQRRACFNATETDFPAPKPPPQAQIEGTWQRKVRGCRGAAGVALGCFGSDPNARAAFGYENQIFVICTENFVTGQNALQRHRNRISGCQIALLGGQSGSTCKTLP